MNYHLAQVNIARTLAPLDSPVMRDFVNNLDHINQLAEQSPGFVWRYQDNQGNTDQVRVFEDPFVLVNLSVWETREALFNFTYATDHVNIFKRKKEWFQKMTDKHMALWYIADGKYPTVEEALERLNHLNRKGESPFAFGFKSNFTPVDALDYRPQV